MAPTLLLKLCPSKHRYATAHNTAAVAFL